MAGLRVGQAFGMFLLPGFGVGSSSPWVPGHPTSMCDSGVKCVFYVWVANSLVHNQQNQKQSMTAVLRSLNEQLL